MGVARLARFSWLWLLGKRTEELAVNMVNMPISPLFRTGEGNNLGKKNQQHINTRRQPFDSLHSQHAAPTPPTGDGCRSSGEVFMAVAVRGNEPKNLLSTW